MFEWIWEKFLWVSGLGTFITTVEKEPALGVALSLCLALSLAWLFWLTPKFAVWNGKRVGGIGIGLLTIVIGAAIYYAIFKAVVFLGLGFIVSALKMIPVIGDALANIAHYLISGLATFVITLLVGLYFLKNIPALVKKCVGVLVGAQKEWKADEGEGFHRVQWHFVILGNLMVAGMICHPGLNAWGTGYYVPAGLSAALGIYAIVRKFFLAKPAKKGKSATADKRKRKGSKKPTARTRVDCPNPDCDKHPLATMDFCPACGTSLKEEKPRPRRRTKRPPRKELRCEHCQELLPPGAKFCIECGTSREEEAVPVPAPPEPKAPEPKNRPVNGGKPRRPGMVKPFTHKDMFYR